MELKIMGIKSMENRSLNREVVRYDSFEAMREARAMLASGLEVVIVNDDGAVVYASNPHWGYLFEEPKSGAWINQYSMSYTDVVGDVHTIFKIYLEQENNLSHLLTQLIEFEELGRERQQVPELMDPLNINWRLLTGYLQTLSIPSGTTWAQQYPTEMEDWLNQIFYFSGEDLQYVSFSNSTVTVN